MFLADKDYHGGKHDGTDLRHVSRRAIGCGNGHRWGGSALRPGLACRTLVWMFILREGHSPRSARLVHIRNGSLTPQLSNEYHKRTAQLVNAFIDSQLCEMDNDGNVEYQEEPMPRVSVNY
jgi:hypothetical protein